MGKDKSKEDPSILEAVDNLSSMAELDIEDFKKKKDGEKVGVNTTRWLDPIDEKKTIESVKNTLKVVSNYLKQIYKKNASQLKDKSMQKGVVAIMKLATEAVDKVDDYARQTKKKINIKNSKEYVFLIEFYEKKIKSRFDGSLTSDQEMENDYEEDAADIKARGIRDIASVTRDRDYELFYLRNENGGRFFNANLARHIRLVADFDQIISAFSVIDPLTKVPLLKDDIAYHLCRQLKSRLKHELDEVVKISGTHRDDPLVQSVFRGTMALLLASNAKNQLKITTGKSVSGYFKDFQMHMRSALSSIDYRNYIDNPPEEDFYIKLLGLLHMMCFVIYTAHINTTEVGALLSGIINSKEKKSSKSKRSSFALWNTILDDYDSLQSVFNSCPNGPLFKILDVLIEAEAFSEFDPIIQGDFPGNYFAFKSKSLSSEFLKIPSPTMQTSITSADLSFEFLGFLRGLVLQQKKLLLFNFQDRTSWKEYARANKIEKCALDAEVGCALTVVTLTKSTAFYNQIDDYLHIDTADDFKKIFFKQLEGEEGCGYYYPKKLDRNRFFSFCKQMLEEVHKVYFANKKNLSRKNRMDFIEIAYHMLYLFFINEEKANYIAFSAKDGVDISAIELSSMFAFLKTISGELEWRAEEEDFMIEMIYSSALIVRERAPFITPLKRTADMLGLLIAELELDKKKIQTSLKTLFGDVYKQIEVKRYTA